MGGEEGTGFTIPSTCFSVNPSFQACASLQLSFVSEIFSASWSPWWLLPHLLFLFCHLLWLLHPSSSVTISLFAFYSPEICWALPFLWLPFTVDVNHFYSITISLMRFGRGRGEIVYVLSTALSPFALWNVLAGNKDCEGRKYSHFMIHSALLNLLLLFVQVLFLQQKEKNTRKNPL